MRRDEEKNVPSKQRYLSAEYLMKNIDTSKCVHTLVCT